MQSRPDYGIDAPPVVRNLLIAGVACIIVGLIAYFSLGYFQRKAAIVFLFVLLFSSLCFIITAAAMIWSSKRGKRRQCEKLIDSFDLKGTEVILDVGCGRGLLLNCAAKKLKTGKAIGLDIWQSQDQSGNDPQVTLSNARLEGVVNRVEIKSGDMRQMPIDSGSIDIVTASISIHNIPNREGRRTAITEIDRVLKPGGRIALMDFQYVEEYAETLRSLGWSKPEVSKLNFLFFPPVRVLTGVKGRK